MKAIKTFIPPLVCWFTITLVCSIFGWIIFEVFAKGLKNISFDFLMSSPLDSGRSGGIGPIIISTLMILSVSLCVSLPIAIGCSLYLAEFTKGGSLAGKLIRGSLDVLAGVPSIVFGLFGNVLFCKVLGLGFSILSGGLTLSCMILPLLIRTTEEGIRSVPLDYNLQAASLGMSKSSTIFHVLIPCALPAITVGTILSVGRAAAETAALIFTSGYVTRMPGSIFDSGRSLTIHIYDLAMNVPGGTENAYSSAVVLITLILIINIMSKQIMRFWSVNRR